MQSSEPTPPSRTILAQSFPTFANSPNVRAFNLFDYVSNLSLNPQKCVRIPLGVDLTQEIKIQVRSYLKKLHPLIGTVCHQWHHLLEELTQFPLKINLKPIV